jgi:uncharacterized membrane protein YraQ (UPF0718 family)
MLAALVHAIEVAASMLWEITWALVIGFGLSGAVQAVVRKDQIVRLMPDARIRSLSTAAGLGAASSSCSYAAVALARSLFRKGADFTAAMAFEIASTNLVVELGILLALLLGWQFTVAEFVGGPLMIVFVALLFRLWLRGQIVDAAREQADKGIPGSMEGHAAMDMSVHDDRPLLRRLFSPAGFTSTSHFFVMDVTAIWKDVLGGLLIAGAFAAWIPLSWLGSFFLEGHPLAAKIWGPLIGPVISVFSFVCSIGNVPLAAVLWNGGMSFGGVVSFLFADLIIIPILLIYRRYYGTAMMLRILAAFYIAMVLAGYVVELVFTPLGLIPDVRNAVVLEPSISWNYTTYLNIVAIAVTVALTVRFVRTGGLPMLAMMGGSPDEQHHDHDHHH